MEIKEKQQNRVTLIISIVGGMPLEVIIIHMTTLQ